MTELEVGLMERIRGKNLDTPICQIRVFRINDPNYTYEFIRQEGNEALVMDDNNEQSDGKKELRMFPANELVNVAVFQEALLTLLKSHETALPQQE